MENLDHEHDGLSLKELFNQGVENPFGLHQLCSDVNSLSKSVTFGQNLAASLSIEEIPQTDPKERHSYLADPVQSLLSSLEMCGEAGYPNGDQSLLGSEEDSIRSLGIDFDANATNIVNEVLKEEDKSYLFEEDYTLNYESPVRERNTAAECQAQCESLCTPEVSRASCVVEKGLWTSRTKRKIGFDGSAKSGGLKSVEFHDKLYKETLPMNLNENINLDKEVELIATSFSAGVDEALVPGENLVILQEVDKFHQEESEISISGETLKRRPKCRAKMIGNVVLSKENDHNTTKRISKKPPQQSIMKVVQNHQPSNSANENPTHLSQAETVTAKTDAGKHIYLSASQIFVVHLFSAVVLCPQLNNVAKVSELFLFFFYSFGSVRFLFDSPSPILRSPTPKRG